MTLTRKDLRRGVYPHNLIFSAVFARLYLIFILHFFVIKTHESSPDPGNFHQYRI